MVKKFWYLWHWYIDAESYLTPAVDALIFAAMVYAMYRFLVFIVSV